MKNACIIMACNVPWRWSADYINQTAIHLARRGNTVICFFWYQARSLKEHAISFSMPSLFFRHKKGIYFYDGIHILPLRRFAVIRKLNFHLNILFIRCFIFVLHMRQRFTAVYSWYFDPRLYPLVSMLAAPSGFIYDCVDYWSGIPDISVTERRRLQLLERKGIRAAFAVFVNSRTLFRIHSKIRKQIYRVPQGFRLDSFQTRRLATSNVSYPKPIIGYVGDINNRIDFHLLIRVAKRFPHYHFVFAGPRIHPGYLHGEKHFFSLPNVHEIGWIDKSRIPGLIRSFSVGIIPYRFKHDFNKYSYPMKVFEYFYEGKPVISTPIEELQQFDRYIRTGATARQWERHLGLLLSKPWPSSYGSAQRKIAVANSWNRKIAAMCSVIENISSTRRGDS